MKKSTVFCTIAILLASLVLGSCQGVIFDEIRKEVKLKSASVEGDVHSIVRFKDYLFVDNGNIYYKNVTTTKSRGGWTKSSMAGMNVDHVIKLAADSTYVYALGVVLEKDDDEGEMVESERRLYCSTDGNNWSLVMNFPATYIGTIFCTNAANKDNRSAYVNLLPGVSGSVPYKLNGTNTPTAHGAEVVGTEASAKSAAHFNGNVYISSYYGMASNDTYLYYGDGDYIYYLSNDTDAEWKSVDTDEGSIVSISVTSNYLILGTTNGYAHVGLNDGVPSGGTGNLPANVESALSSSYEVWSVLALDPTATETANDIYATATYSGSSSSSSATRSKEGLWAYYPSENEWNLD